MASVMSAQYRADLEELYMEYLNAEKVILKSGQEYSIGDRTLRRTDISWIQKERKRIANELAKLDAGKGVRSQRVGIIYDT